MRTVFCSLGLGRSWLTNFLLLLVDVADPVPPAKTVVIVIGFPGYWGRTWELAYLVDDIWFF
jgi:hypothetical protein